MKVPRAFVWNIVIVIINIGKPYEADFYTWQDSKMLILSLLSTIHHRFKRHNEEKPVVFIGVEYSDTSPVQNEWGVHKCHKYASTNPKEVQLQLSTSVGLKYI